MAMVTPAELSPDASFALGCCTKVKGGIVAPQRMTYATYRFATRRPERGKQHGTVDCPRCGATIPLSILAVSDVRRRRRNCRTAWTVASVISFVTPIAIMLATGDDEWLAIGPLLIPGIGLAIAAVVHPPSMTGISIARKARGQHIVTR
ncbi:MULTISPECIES: hypothetical protein [Prauserella salsuginis group]|uniref:Uncharacterized protein n=2 Tax=Prauserella salsuginis group TaxID=2893672 RepID=A0A839XVN9_9PSEU|nr:MULTISPECIES: hypothetical protein [Prauserella salsuginis group]MBB3664076.1 hypothetical protein [Prauserella sediminis]MCR3721530.1 hypothetical protein [Prauserella flava]MCR3734222.1 hypothetical protein [Prauserella salsuginis]